MAIAKQRLTVENHIKTATERLGARAKWLEGQKTGKKPRRDPVYRHLEALLRQQKRRIISMDRTQAFIEEARQRVAERRAQPKVKKEKAAAPAPAAKGKKGK